MKTLIIHTKTNISIWFLILYNKCLNERFERLNKVIDYIDLNVNLENLQLY